MENKKSLDGNLGKDLKKSDRNKYRQNSFNQRTSKQIVGCKQQSKILEALSSANTSLNMRQISTLTGIERPTLCRRIAELMNKSRIKIDKYAPCPISKYAPVGFYVINRQ